MFDRLKRRLVSWVLSSHLERWIRVEEKDIQVSDWGVSASRVKIRSACLDALSLPLAADGDGHAKRVAVEWISRSAFRVVFEDVEVRVRPRQTESDWDDETSARVKHVLLLERLQQWEHQRDREEALEMASKGGHKQEGQEGSGRGTENDQEQQNRDRATRMQAVAHALVTNLHVEVHNLQLVYVDPYIGEIMRVVIGNLCLDRDVGMEQSMPGRLCKEATLEGLSVHVLGARNELHELIKPAMALAKFTYVDPWKRGEEKEGEDGGTHSKNLPAKSLMLDIQDGQVVADKAQAVMVSQISDVLLHHRPYRPLRRPLADSAAPLSWWQYAGRLVLDDIRRRRAWWNPKEMLERKAAEEMYIKAYNMPHVQGRLPDAAKQDLERLEIGRTYEQITYWRIQARKQRAEQRMQTQLAMQKEWSIEMERSQSKSSDLEVKQPRTWWGWITGRSKAVEADTFTEDEIREVLQALGETDDNLESGGWSPLLEESFDASDFEQTDEALNTTLELRISSGAVQLLEEGRVNQIANMAMKGGKVLLQVKPSQTMLVLQLSGAWIRDCYGASILRYPAESSPDALTQKSASFQVLTNWSVYPAKVDIKVKTSSVKFSLSPSFEQRVINFFSTQYGGRSEHQVDMYEDEDSAAIGPIMSFLGVVGSVKVTADVEGPQLYLPERHGIAALSMGFTQANEHEVLVYRMGHLQLDTEITEGKSVLHGMSTFLNRYHIGIKGMSVQMCRFSTSELASLGDPLLPGIDIFRMNVSSTSMLSLPVLAKDEVVEVDTNLSTVIRFQDMDFSCNLSVARSSAIIISSWASSHWREPPLPTISKWKRKIEGYLLVHKAEIGWKWKWAVLHGHRLELLQYKHSDSVDLSLDLAHYTLVEEVLDGSLRVMSFYNYLDREQLSNPAAKKIVLFAGHLAHDHWLEKLRNSQENILVNKLKGPTKKRISEQVTELAEAYKKAHGGSREAQEVSGPTSKRRQLERVFRYCLLLEVNNASFELKLQDDYETPYVTYSDVRLSFTGGKFNMDGAIPGKANASLKIMKLGIDSKSDQSQFGILKMDSGEKPALQTIFADNSDCNSIKFSLGQIDLRLSPKVLETSYLVQEAITSSWTGGCHSVASFRTNQLVVTRTKSPLGMVFRMVGTGEEGPNATVPAPLQQAEQSTMSLESPVSSAREKGNKKCILCSCELDSANEFLTFLNCGHAKSKDFPLVSTSSDQADGIVISLNTLELELFDKHENKLSAVSASGIRGVQEKNKQQMCHLHVDMESISVKDSSPQGKLYESILSTDCVDGPALLMDYYAYDPMDLSFPGVGSDLKVKLKNPRIVALMRFVQDCFLNARWLPKLPSKVEMPVPLNVSEISNDPPLERLNVRGRRMQSTILLINPCLQIPRCSTSKELLELNLSKLSANNFFRIDGQTKGTTEHSEGSGIEDLEGKAYLDEKEARCMQVWQVSLDECRIKTQNDDISSILSSLFDLNIGVEIPFLIAGAQVPPSMASMSIQASVPSLQLSASDFQLNLLLGILGGNLAEQSIMPGDEKIEILKIPNLEHGLSALISHEVKGPSHTRSLPVYMEFSLEVGELELDALLASGLLDPDPLCLAKIKAEQFSICFLNFRDDVEVDDVKIFSRCDTSIRSLTILNSMDRSVSNGMAAVTFQNTDSEGCNSEALVIWMEKQSLNKHTIIDVKFAEPRIEGNKGFLLSVLGYLGLAFSSAPCPLNFLDEDGRELFRYSAEAPNIISGMAIRLSLPSCKIFIPCGAGEGFLAQGDAKATYCSILQESLLETNLVDMQLKGASMKSSLQSMHFTENLDSSTRDIVSPFKVEFAWKTGSAHSSSNLTQKYTLCVSPVRLMVSYEDFVLLATAAQLLSAQQKVSRRNGADDSQLTSEYSMVQTQNVINATITFQGFQLIAVDDFGNKWIPLVRTTFHHLNAQASSIDGATNVLLDLSMQIETYEYYLAHWSIFLEPWNFEAKLKIQPPAQKDMILRQGSMQSILQIDSNRAALRISSTFLNTLTLVAKSWSKDSRLSTIFSGEHVEPMNAPILEISSEKQFYPFVIRNLTSSSLICTIRDKDHVLVPRQELKFNYSEVFGIDDLHSVETFSSGNTPCPAVCNLGFDGCDAISGVRLDRVGSHSYTLQPVENSRLCDADDLLSKFTAETIVENGCMVTCLLPPLMVTNLTSVSLYGALIRVKPKSVTEEDNIVLEELGEFKPGEIMPFPVPARTDQELCILPATTKQYSVEDWFNGKFLDLWKVRDRDLPFAFLHRVLSADADSDMQSAQFFSVSLKRSPSSTAYNFFQQSAYDVWKTTCFTNPFPAKDTVLESLSDARLSPNVTLELTTPVLLCNGLPQEIGVELLGLPVPPDKMKSRAFGGRAFSHDVNPQSVQYALGAGEIVSVEEIDTHRNLFIRFCLGDINNADSVWSGFSSLPLDKVEHTLTLAATEYPLGHLSVNLSVDYHHEYNCVAAKIWSSFWIINMCGLPLEFHLQNQNADVATLLDQEWQGGKDIKELAVASNRQRFIAQPHERPCIVSEFQPVGSSLDVALRMAGSETSFSPVLTNDSLSVGPKLLHVNPVHVAIGLARPERAIFKDTQVFVLAPQCIVHNATDENLSVWQTYHVESHNNSLAEGSTRRQDLCGNPSRPMIASLPAGVSEPCFLEGELTQSRLAISNVNGEPSVSFSPYDTGSVLLRLPASGTDVSKWPKIQIVFENIGGSATQVVHITKFAQHDRAMYRIANRSGVAVAFCQELPLGSEVEVVEAKSNADIFWQDPCAPPLLRVWPCQWQFGSSRPSIVSLIDMHDMEAEPTRLLAGRTQGAQLELRMVPEKGSFVLEIKGPYSPTGELVEHEATGEEALLHSTKNKGGSFLVMLRIESVRLELLMESTHDQDHTGGKVDTLQPVLFSELGLVQLSCDTDSQKRIVQAHVGRLQLEHRSVRTLFPVIARSKPGPEGMLRFSVEQKLDHGEPGRTSVFKLVALRLPDLDVSLDEAGLTRLRYVSEGWSRGMQWEDESTQDSSCKGTIPRVAASMRQRLRLGQEGIPSITSSEDRFASSVYVEDLRIERSSLSLSVQMRGLSADDVMLGLPSVRFQRALRPPTELVASLMEECRRAATEKHWEIAAAFVRGGVRRAARQLLGRTSTMSRLDEVPPASNLPWYRRISKTTPAKRRT